jgi:hypothetical protein
MIPGSEIIHLQSAFADWNRPVSGHPSPGRKCRSRVATLRAKGFVGEKSDLKVTRLPNPVLQSADAKEALTLSGANQRNALYASNHDNENPRQSKPKPSQSDKLQTNSQNSASLQSDLQLDHHYHHHHPLVSSLQLNELNKPLFPSPSLLSPNNSSRLSISNASAFEESKLSKVDSRIGDSLQYGYGLKISVKWVHIPEEFDY